MNADRSCLIPEDPEIKHLDTALQADKMLCVFQERLYAGQPATIVACRIERIKYKPQKNCHVSYLLQVRDGKSSAMHELRVCSRFYEQRGSTARFSRESGRTSSAERLLHIPELDCITWIFPNDRKLRHLPQVVDADFLQRNAAPPLTARYAGHGWTIRNFQARTIRYVPEQSCTVRAELEIARHGNGEQCSFVVYGKTSYHAGGQQLLQYMQQLWRSPASQAGRLHIPQPLLYQPGLRLLWQTGVPGRMLSELCGNKGLFVDAVGNAARQIALLHQTPLHDFPGPKPDHELRKLDKVRQLLCKTDAPDRDAIIPLIDRLEALFPSPQPQQLVTLHGDLHLKNILVAGGTVYLIDLDSIGRGNPLRDIGSFIAAIINQLLLGAIPEPLAMQAIKVFLQSYNGAPRMSINASQLRSYIALALVVERIFRSFTRLKAGRMAIITALGEQARMLLDDSSTPEWLTASGLT